MVAGLLLILTHFLRIGIFGCIHGVKTVIEELVSPVGVLLEQIPNLLLDGVVRSRHVLRKESLDGEGFLEGGYGILAGIGEGVDLVVGQIESEKEAGSGGIQ
jgi:hypothetical protein